MDMLWTSSLLSHCAHNCSPKSLWHANGKNLPLKAVSTTGLGGLGGLALRWWKLPVSNGQSLPKTAWIDCNSACQRSPSHAAQVLTNTLLAFASLASSASPLGQRESDWEWNALNPARSLAYFLPINGGRSQVKLWQKQKWVATSDIRWWARNSWAWTQ